GFYKYQDSKPLKVKTRARPQPADLQDRLILPMINEAVAVLREQLVDDSDLLDAGVIFGTGFAPFRGGPINYIRATGVANLKARLEKLVPSHGARFTPDKGWDAPALKEPKA
ncbi:MAG: 3-hydroxyacyl-CoA dehydrogenase NAD-binding domain-containing protein, partial [Gammaproteobacteria bacterium]